MPYCSSCSAATVSGARYCSSCGADQSWGAVPAQPPPPASSQFSLGDPAWFPPAPQPYGAASERNVAMWTHLAPLIMWGVALLLGATGVGLLVGFLCWIPPLVMRNSTTGKSSQFARVQATESLNLQLTALIISTAYLVLVLIGVGILFAGSLGGFGVIWLVVIAGVALYVLAVVQMIMGAVKAHGGQHFRYWINFRMVKP